MAKPVICGTLLRVLQRFVSLADFLELAFSFRIIRIAIRMIFHGEFAKGCLQRLVVCCSFNTQSFVVVDLHQFVIPATGTRLLFSRTSYPETGPQIRATRPEAFNTCQGPAFPIVHQSKCLSRPICRRSTPGFSINTHFARNRLVLFKMYAGQSDFSNGGFARYFHRYSTDTGQHAGLIQNLRI